MIRPLVLSFVLLLGACASWKPVVKDVLSIAQVTCAIANAGTDDATVQQICGIADALIPDLKEVLKEQRKQMARVRACQGAKP